MKKIYKDINPIKSQMKPAYATIIALLYLLASLFLLGVFSSCKKINDDWTTFIIKEGKHRSTRALNYSRDTIFNWSIKFDSSAIYKTSDTANQLDVNKLIGWSDCGEDHMESSIRFGWRWVDSLEIHWFKHENGHFSFGKMTNINLCEEYEYYLKIHDWDYELSVNGVQTFIPRNCIVHKRRYQLYPYFGGNETAPHDIKIKIKHTNY
jgi:hypothetical protein|tara:strand:- start:13 stop:636 length:624 start_codon:yes stop_codon:yes gene_type:complete